MMRAGEANGPGWWNINGDDDGDNEIERKIMTTMRNFQEIVKFFTNSKDSNSLLTMQAVTQELYRCADECLSKGVKMGIKDDVADGFN